MARDPLWEGKRNSLPSSYATGRAGDFDVTNLDGNVNINSDNAGVRLQDLGGNVKIDTRRGDVVRCTNIRGAVELKGRNSDLELRKVAGQVTISGTYPGTINLRELAKPVHIDNVETALNGAYARLDRLAEWRNYVATLRQANLRKRRLVEVLDLLVAEKAHPR